MKIISILDATAFISITVGIISTFKLIKIKRNYKLTGNKKFLYKKTKFLLITLIIGCLSFIIQLIFIVRMVMGEK